jgi:WD40 repeat protein
VEFQDDTTLVSCSRDGSTKFWDISTGTPKSEVPGENFTFSKESAGTEQGDGHFLVTAKDNLVLVYHADREANDGKEAVAFFHAPSPVQSISCTGDHIGVGCKSGSVLHLRAPLACGGAGGLSRARCARLLHVSVYLSHVYCMRSK